jgi:hypothetical protein
MRGTRSGIQQLPWVFYAFLLVAPLAGCLDDDGSPTDVREELSVGYLGTSACGGCHTDILNTFIRTGHPYKLNKIENGQPPLYPFSTVPGPPSGYSWSDITYVIGGFGWKARFIGQDGYIITEGGQNQYNLATGGWVDYHKDELKPYDCGPCHTTGYNPLGNQDGLEGLIGTWAAPGVQCEECHGPGALHALNPGEVDMTIDTRADACGKCHNRGGYNTTIPASGGFTKHHEQGNEHLNSPHKELNCVACHDPHVSAVYQPDQAIRTECESCHASAAASFEASPLAQQHGAVECITCHMPKSAKSAVAFGDYEGDIRSHLVKINPSADAEQFSPDGSTTNPYVTTEFACLNCHDDKDKEWAELGASLIHDDSHAPGSGSYVGSETCSLCHDYYYDDFVQSGHPYKLNKVVDGQAPTYPFSTVPSTPAGYSWSDISYVIGGYGWKARFIGLDGFIITAGGMNQYNLATQTWSDYHKDEVKPYDCGACHTTGYSPVGHQDGLEGLIGTWAEPGVGCEACHGPGLDHIRSPTTVSMTVDTESESCGACHNRGGVNSTIPASGGFIRHHEQYNEMQNSAHNQLNCVTCHDPHRATRLRDQADNSGLRTECESCHTDARTSIEANSLASFKKDFTCESCHMPPMTKSAVALGEFKGDVATHLWRINPSRRAEPFTEDGKAASGFLTTEFSCLRSGCHTDRNKLWADLQHERIHGVGYSAVGALEAGMPDR